jgi:hypothetical protein
MAIIYLYLPFPFLNTPQNLTKYAVELHILLKDIITIMRFHFFFILSDWKLDNICYYREITMVFGDWTNKYVGFLLN